VPNNLEGEYLTMFSRGGLIFGIINLVGARFSGNYPAWTEDYTSSLLEGCSQALR